MNKVMLMGRLTREPELRYTQKSGKAVCKFTLAVDRRFSQSKEAKQADFLPVVSWEKLAEFCHNYFTKGRKVVVVGRLETSSWEDEEGVKHYATEIIASEAYFADNKKRGTEASEASEEEQETDEVQEFNIAM